MSDSKARLEAENAALRVIAERQAEILLEIGAAMGHANALERTRAAIAKLPRPADPPPRPGPRPPSPTVSALLVGLAALGPGGTGSLSRRYR